MTQHPWEDPRTVLKRHGLRPKRSFSQNFLVSETAIRNIAGAVRAEPGALVIELGPGLGTLTAALLNRGYRVLAVEKDPEMRAVLQAEFGNDQSLHVVDGDASEVSLSALTETAIGAVVGNLPYSITGAIFRNLTTQHRDIPEAVLMIQREVRDRLIASPGKGDYGALSVFVQAAYDVVPVCMVKAGCFHPPPKVDSAVVHLSALPTPRYPETESFRAVVRAAFQRRRKTLRNALGGVVAEKHIVDQLLETSGIDGRRRGETLSVEEFGSLADELNRVQSPSSP